eukprot:gene4947-34723_t
MSEDSIWFSSQEAEDGHHVLLVTAKAKTALKYELVQLPTDVETFSITLPGGIAVKVPLAALRAEQMLMVGDAKEEMFGEERLDVAAAAALERLERKEQKKKDKAERKEQKADDQAKMKGEMEAKMEMGGGDGSLKTKEQKKMDKAERKEKKAEEKEKEKVKEEKAARMEMGAWDDSLERKEQKKKEMAEEKTMMEMGDSDDSEDEESGSDADDVDEKMAAASSAFLPAGSAKCLAGASTSASGSGLPRLPQPRKSPDRTCSYHISLDEEGSDSIGQAGASVGVLAVKCCEVKAQRAAGEADASNASP